MLNAFLKVVFCQFALFILSDKQTDFRLREGLWICFDSISATQMIKFTKEK